MSTQLTAQSTPLGNLHDTTYTELIARINVRVRNLTDAGTLPIFLTDAKNLWTTYLDSFADSERQACNCHTCRRFIEKYGSLVVVDETGRTAPLLWSAEEPNAAYRLAFARMSKVIRNAAVVGVFYSDESTWGTHVTGVWQHLAVKPPKQLVYHPSAEGRTAYQAAAYKLEDFHNVRRALLAFPKAHIETALTLLRSDALYRSEKVLAQAEWLHKLHLARAAAYDSRRHNVIWRAVATAPAGFCHPRSSVLGTLLSDIADGKSFSEISRAFSEKMDPTRYQRPQAAPNAGTILYAEQLVQTLGVERSLARRFATLDDLTTVWVSAAVTLRRDPTKSTSITPNLGVFSHLQPKLKHGDTARHESLNPDLTTLTWARFQRLVLPNAERIEVLAPARGPYGALVTAADPDAPPILQWDTPDQRNPVSWYQWVGGAPARNYNVSPNTFVAVEAITLQPSMWHTDNTHHGQGIFLVLSGASETRTDQGLGLFPEILKSEFHGIRSVIERFSTAGCIAGLDSPHVAGLLLQTRLSAFRCTTTIRVWSLGRPTDYRLDRWY